MFCERIENGGKERVVRPGHDRQPHRIDILLNGGHGDHLRRLADAGVDDLHTRVAQSPGNDLCPPVMAVQTRLGDQYADLSF